MKKITRNKVKGIPLILTDVEAYCHKANLKVSLKSILEDISQAAKPFPVVTAAKPD